MGNSCGKEKREKEFFLTQRRRGRRGFIDKLSGCFRALRRKPKGFGRPASHASKNLKVINSLNSSLLTPHS